MTAIAALCSAAAPDTAIRAAMPRVLGAMRRRGLDWTASASVDFATLAQSGYYWESRERREQLARSPAGIIAADTTLVYREDLLRGTRTGDRRDRSDAQLILDAYEADGDDCVKRLEGDFAFVIWDPRHNRLLAARDFTGNRTLFYAASTSRLVVASTVAGVLAEGSVERVLDVDVVAENAAMLWSHTSGTVYRNILELPAGHTLRWTPGKPENVARFWHPPSRFDTSNQSTDDAVEHLRQLLTAAVSERLSPEGETSVTLSGGWDSSAVYGAAQTALKNSGDSSRHIRAVSISFPQGDPGREDEFIRSIIGEWGGEVSWIDVGSLRVFDPRNRDTANNDGPVPHGFEAWNKAMFRESARRGTRVVLGGSGGDQLFQLSLAYIADLVRKGRIAEAIRQWRARGGETVRGFLQTGVTPLLRPTPGSLWTSLFRVRPRNFYLDRQAPQWMRRQFVATHEIDRRDASTRPHLPNSSCAMADTHAFLLFPYFHRVAGDVFSFGLEEGVEVKQPLLDNRIVNFAVPRPWYEKANGSETKILLRRAMRGLLPDSVLAPRKSRTGMASTGFVRDMQTQGYRLSQGVEGDSILADLGIVEPAELNSAWSKFVGSGDERLAARLYCTLQTELWLRETHGQNAPSVTCEHMPTSASRANSR